MECFEKFLVFSIFFLKLLSVFTQEDNLTFLITGGYRPRKHTLVKHIVSLRLPTTKASPFGYTHICGGSIIAARDILTAAHCVWDTEFKRARHSKKVQIVAKTPNRLKMSNHTQIIKVAQIIVHPRYKDKNFRNDIAVLHLESDILEDNSTGQRIELADDAPKTGTKCTLVGWGCLFEHGPEAADALYTDVYILKLSTCGELHKKFTYAGMMCAGDMSDPYKDSCHGDSGGPLICNGKITGVVSYGYGCGRLPGIYADVWYYRDWILHCGNSSNSLKISKLVLLPLLVWIVNSFYSFFSKFK